MRRSLAAATAFALALALGACGGDSSDDSALVSAPEAEQELDEHLATLNAAIAKRDCETAMEETFSQLRIPPGKPAPGELAEPGSPATAEECKRSAPVHDLLAQLKGTEFTESEENGPAAVSEGTADTRTQGYERWVVVSMVDRDGSWRDTVFFPVDPQLEADRNPQADPGAVVNQMIEATRARSCKNAEELFDPFGRLGEGKGKDGGAAAACDNTVNGIFFAPSLRETPAEDVAPEELVATRDLSIWGVPTREAYYTVTLITPPAKPGSPPQETFLVTDLSLLTEAEPNQARARG